MQNYSLERLCDQSPTAKTCHSRAGPGSSRPCLVLITLHTLQPPQNKPPELGRQDKQGDVVTELNRALKLIQFTEHQLILKTQYKEQ